ncbi:MAG: hypothetical protein ACE15B_00965 [Bryobacteraceae bacterium]
MLNAAFLTQNLQNPEQRFLPDILDRGRQTQAGLQFQRKQITEIPAEMLLDIRIPVAEPLDIFQGKIEEVQLSAFGEIISQDFWAAGVL